MTNGRLKPIKGVVIHFDQIEVAWQTPSQFKRESKFIEKASIARKKKIQDLEAVISFYKAQGTASADLRAKLHTKRLENAKKDSVLSSKRAYENISYGKTEQEPDSVRLIKSMEAEISEKLNKLSPDEFEKWKAKKYLKLKEKQTLGEIRSRERMTKKRRFTHRIAATKVFSIKHIDGSETVVYSPDTMGFLAIDTTPDLDYSIREMRNYIKGQQDGRRHRTNIDTEVGFVSGMLSAGLGNFYGPIGPAVGMGIQALIPVKIQEKACTNPDLKDNDAYFDGYNQAAKRRKILNYGLGGVLGLGFGFLMYSGLFQ